MHAHNFELYVKRGIFRLLVAQSYLVGGERCTTSGTVGGNFVALVDEPFIPELPYYPPARFDVLPVERNVGVLVIYKIAYPFTQVLPFPHIMKSALSAALVKLLYSVIFNLRFAGDA